MMYILRSDIKALVEKRVSSSSLIEVTAALVIISLVFSMAIMIYLHIQKNSFFSVKLAHSVMMDNMFTESQRMDKFEARQVNQGEIIIYQEVANYQSIDNLKVVHLEARDENGKLLAEQNRLVYVPDH